MAAFVFALTHLVLDGIMKAFQGVQKSCAPQDILGESNIPVK